MSDTPATSPATPPAQAKPAKKTIERGEINKTFLIEVSNSRKVAVAARDPAHAPRLTAVELDVAVLDKLEALATKVETDIGKLRGTRAAKKAMTVQEKAARAELIGELQPIQTAAKRRFEGDTAKLREAYFIGAGLSGLSLDQVLAAARNVRARLVAGPDNAPPQDILPGVTAAGAIKDLTDAIVKYGGKDTDQGKEKQKASSALEAIERDVIALAGLRKEVQLAADQAWPWRKSGVATIRKLFLLPADRPLPDRQTEA